MSGLKFIALSGTTAVNENLYIYESGNDMMVVDCGLGFPDSEKYGVDVVIPDFSYILKNLSKLKGILISHGHEDHIGALPFLLKEIKAEIYSTKLVAAFIEYKLKDAGVKGVKINVFDPDKDDVVNIGVFQIRPFRVAHSVPDSVGYAIDTPEGRMFHVAEHKFEKDPVDGHRVDEQKTRRLASKGVIALASDCLGSNKEGFTPSEKEIESRIEAIAKKANKAIFFTTISSSISRMQQAINVAQKMKRKVVFVGRTVDTKATIAHDLGYLNYPEGLVLSPRDAGRLSGNKKMYIIAGSYGQVGSALQRIAEKDHRFLSIEKDDMVIFSSDPAPPGAKETVDHVVDRLLELGADVHYYDLHENLHVSGHGNQEDIKRLFGIVKPQYYIPIGGTIRHMKAYEKLVKSIGVRTDSVFELKVGEVVEISNGKAKKSGKIDVKEILVDGLGIGDVGRVVLADRKTLAKGGVVVVSIQIDKKNKNMLSNPEITSRGFVFEKKDKAFLMDAGRKLREEIERSRRINKATIEKATSKYLGRFFLDEIGRRPMIIPVVIEI